MNQLAIGTTTLNVKDYECSDNGVYLPKDKLRLWLYVNLTDACPAACPFCVHASAEMIFGSQFDISLFEQTLVQISPFVNGISLTGGEPMTSTTLIEEIVDVIQRHISPDIELDMVTNGLNIQTLPEIRGIERFATVHISRHAVTDDANQHLMRWPAAPSAEALKSVFAKLKDPGMTVLNCVLQKAGIHDRASAKEYLQFGADVGAANVSFIGMFTANEYCRQNYISPACLAFDADKHFNIWNHFHDHEYCQCSTGNYHAQAGWIRYYYRCPGKQAAPDYCRQLVYGSDNILRAGFGNAAIIRLE